MEAKPDAKSCCSPAPGTSSCMDGQTAESIQTGAADIAFQRIARGPTANMTLIPAGTFLMGTQDADGWADDGEGPVREVSVDAFWIDRTAVTNAMFAEFVAASGYVTESERYGWSYVFLGQLSKSQQKKLRATRAVKGLQWWYGIEGASWQHPEGPGSTLLKRMDHPVAHVSWHDAHAYCQWAEKRLPTEAEWEMAARGGLVQQRYCWGNELTPAGKHRCNIWQGTFPTHNTSEDGYNWTAPAKSFKPNGYGLYNMAGNVWEWCFDWFSPFWHQKASAQTRNNPNGPPVGKNKVMRGGSFLCHASYCNRYRVGARTSNTPDSAATNVGFRCVRDAADIQRNSASSAARKTGP